MTRRDYLLGTTSALLASAATPPSSWPHWGGPHGNFEVPDGPPLKSKWPASGPKVLWRRPLGDGYSSPAVEDGVIYTMYSPNRGVEMTTAIQAADGKTIWEQQAVRHHFRSDAPDMGHGPYATPLLAGDRIVATSVNGHLECRLRKTGALVWKQELWEDHHGTRLVYGYASSPIAYRDTVIVPCGGKGKALMAFRLSDGGLVWSANDYPNVYSTPIVINVAGLDQLVALMDGFVAGLNPLNGDHQWRVPFKASYSIAVSSPAWISTPAGRLLFVSSEYDAGTKMIRLDRQPTKIEPTEVWSANRLRLHHGNAICVDGTLYFSSGGKGSVAMLSAVDAATGKIHWQDRRISKASCVYADKKLIALDQDGVLMLIKPDPTKLDILAKFELLTNLSWTPPVLVGTRLYLRDRRSLIAVELG